MLILHGENVILSRQKLEEIINDFKGEIIRLEGHQINLTQLKQAAESQSLFDEDRLVLVENIFFRRPSQEKENLIRYLKEIRPKGLIVWEAKTIDGRTLAPFKGVKTEKFELTRQIFKFLDSLIPHNLQKSLHWLHQCLKQDLPEMIFYMLIRQVRLLLMAKDLGAKGLIRMAPWQQNKLLHQAEKFELQKLLWLHQTLLKIDYEQKTGRAVMPLASQLDLLIASL